MPTVTMPQLGESVEEGTIGKWLKNVGDHVAVGDPLVEVITDKVNAEVPSPFEGTLTKILVNEGETVGNEADIAEVDTEGAAAGADAAPSDGDAATAGDATAASATADDTTGTATPTADDAPDGQDEDERSRDAEPAEVPSGSNGTGTADHAGTDPDERAPAGSPTPVATAVETKPKAPPPSGGNGVARPADANGASSTVAAPIGARMTPAVRRLAREHRVDLARVEGTGIGGRITREDVERAVASGAAGTAAPDAIPAAPDAGTAAQGSASAPTQSAPGQAPTAPSPVAEGDSLKKLTPMRKAIAKQMTRSLEVPTAYITVEVDMSAVVRRRTRANPDYKAREGMSLSYVAFVTKACVEALRRHPDINAHWTEEGHWRRKAINVGIAVAVDDGLVVPVIRDADMLSLHGLNVAINDLAKRSRDKKVQPDEMKGGTFTVDNTGWTGSILTLPIINVPEVAIITMEKVVKRPVVLEGTDGDVIAIRSMMNMCIGIDHRATDGAQAGAFLADVRGWLESVDDSTPIW